MSKSRTIPRVAGPAPKQQPESPIVYTCLKWLLDNGYYVWRNATGGCKAGNRWLHFGLKGSGDIIGMTRSGRFLSVEIKTATGVLRPEQATFMERVRAHGGMAIVARSVEDLVKEGL